MNDKEFLNLIKEAKKDSRDMLEIYKNKKTGTVMKISNPTIEKDGNYYIYVLDIFNENYDIDYNICCDDTLKEVFLEWCVDNKFLEEFDELWIDYHQNFGDIYNKDEQEDITNMNFEDELFNKFYKENKDKYTFFSKVLPLKPDYIYQANIGLNCFYDKCLSNKEIIEIYENLVKNNI